MSTSDVQTVHSKADIALVALAGALAAGGVLGFSFLTQQTLLLRLAVLFGGLTLAVAVAWFSQPGKRFLGFARESYEETRRVVWPSRKETVNTTGIIFLFVVVSALFLFLVDKSLEWVLYDLLLGWR